MASVWRVLVICLGYSVLAGCTQFSGMSGIDRADALGLPIDPATLPELPRLQLLPPTPSAQGADLKQYRDGYVEQWMVRSDILCRQYKDKIMMLSRDTRLATNATQTILSGLATIFTSISVIHPLTGAATIVGGVGAAADSDVFHKQSGEIIAAAIQTARENQGNQIERNLNELPLDKYNIYRAQRDVVEYHNMCSLETGLSQIRVALKASSPDGGTTPPASQGTQINTIQAGVAAEAHNKATAGAMAGAAAAQGKGLSPAAGAALGAAAAAAGSSANAAEIGAKAVANAASAMPPPGLKTTAKAVTPARSRLNVALGSDEAGKKRYDTRLTAFLPQCFEKVGLARTTTLPSFMNRAEPESKFDEMAACIGAAAKVQ
jgi:hypothetical protein